ncbi:MAG: hypothetical protein COA66_13865 [Arcobacter sp.]|nr:MAG: hypothetical protein COA66_13865 [Arcobacter sp.]
MLSKNRNIFTSLNQHISTSKNKDYEIWLKDFIHHPVVVDINKMKKVPNHNSIKNRYSLFHISNNKNYKPPLQRA